MEHKPFLTAAVLALAMGVQAQVHRIEYRWPNVPCGDILNCDAGCSACNVPDASGGVLIGTNAAWIGVATCPLPVSEGDNAVYSAGWPVEPDAGHAIIINGLATMAVRIDSIRFRHAIYQDGPQRVKVLYTNNAAQPLQEIADVEVPAAWTDAQLLDLGPVVAPEGNPFGTFQLRFQPYQGGSGGWALDELIISASVDMGAQTAITELYQRRPAARGPLYDVMGRQVGRDLAPGLYMGQGRRVVMVE